MPRVTYLVDITYNLTDAGPEWAEQIRTKAEEIVRTRHAAKIDAWTARKKDYLRVVQTREACSLAALLVELGEQAKQWAEMPPAAVQFVIRNATYHPTDGLPPSRGFVRVVT